MTQAKTERNERMLTDFQSGKSLYEIAKANGITWTRAKAILIQMGAIPSVKRDFISLEDARHRHYVVCTTGALFRKSGLGNIKCQVCGSANRIEKHHPDYNYPTVVFFLCRKCHQIYHKTDRTLLDGIEPIDLMEEIAKLGEQQEEKES